MIIYTFALLFWFCWFIISKSRAVSTWAAYFLTSTMALGVDLFFSLKLGLYSYNLPFLTNEGSILLLGILGYPVVGVLYLHLRPPGRRGTVLHISGWTALLFLIEIIALRNNELYYPRWELWWSLLVYLAAFAVLTLFHDRLFSKSR